MAALSSTSPAIRGWHRLMIAGKLGVMRFGPGRPRISPEVEQTVIRLAKENPTWGQKRIRSIAEADAERVARVGIAQALGGEDGVTSQDD